MKNGSPAASSISTFSMLANSFPSTNSEFDKLREQAAIQRAAIFFLRHGAGRA